MENIIEKRMKSMKLHEILDITEPPYFRVMKVPGGWLYNFYDDDKDNYQKERWTFVPNEK